MAAHEKLFETLLANLIEGMTPRQIRVVLVLFLLTIGIFLTLYWGVPIWIVLTAGTLIVVLIWYRVFWISNATILLKKLTILFTILYMVAFGLVLTWQWHHVNGLIAEATRLEAESLLPESMKKYEEALKAAQEGKLRTEEMKCQCAIAFLSYLFRPAAETKNSLVACRSLSLQMNANENVARALILMAQMEQDSGSYDLAKQLYKEAQEFLDKEHSKLIQAYLLRGMGGLESNRSNYLLSFQYLDKSIELFREEGRNGEIASVLNMLGDIRVKLAEYETARKYYDDAYSISKENRILLEQGNSLVRIANLERLNGDSAFAEGKYIEARGILRHAIIWKRQRANSNYCLMR